MKSFVIFNPGVRWGVWHQGCLLWHVARPHLAVQGQQGQGHLCKQPEEGWPRLFGIIQIYGSLVRFSVLALRVSLSHAFCSFQNPKACDKGLSVMIRSSCNWFLLQTTSRWMECVLEKYLLFFIGEGLWVVRWLVAWCFISCCTVCVRMCMHICVLYCVCMNVCDDIALAPNHGSSTPLWSPKRTTFWSQLLLIGLFSGTPWRRSGQGHQHCCPKKVWSKMQGNSLIIRWDSITTLCSIQFCFFQDYVLR